MKAGAEKSSSCQQDERRGDAMKALEVMVKAPVTLPVDAGNQHK